MGPWPTGIIERAHMPIPCFPMVLAHPVVYSSPSMKGAARFSRLGTPRLHIPKHRTTRSVISSNQQRPKSSRRKREQTWSHPRAGLSRVRQKSMSSCLRKPRTKIEADLQDALKADLQALEDEYESDKAAIKADWPFPSFCSLSPQWLEWRQTGVFYAVGAAFVNLYKVILLPLTVPVNVALATAKVFKRLFKDLSGANEYHRDQHELWRETMRNLYRVQATLAGKTEKQIDREWKHAQDLKSRRPNRPVSFNRHDDLEDTGRKMRRKMKEEERERKFYQYVFDLMGEDNSWQQGRWKSFQKWKLDPFAALTGWLSMGSEKA